MQFLDQQPTRSVNVHLPALSAISQRTCQSNMVANPSRPDGRRCQTRHFACDARWKQHPKLPSLLWCQPKNNAIPSRKAAVPSQGRYGHQRPCSPHRMVPRVVPNGHARSVLFRPMCVDDGSRELQMSRGPGLCVGIEFGGLTDVERLEAVSNWDIAASE